MQITTSSFFSFDGPGRVSIARAAPRNMVKGFRVLRDLAPGPWFNKVSLAKYVELYRAQLAALDPAATVARIAELAGDAPRAVLLCWEQAPSEIWQSHPGPDAPPNCHRRLVAAWLHETLGLEVPELPTLRVRDVLNSGHYYLHPDATTSAGLPGDDYTRGREFEEIEATGTLAAEKPNVPFFVLEKDIWWPTVREG